MKINLLNNYKPGKGKKSAFQFSVCNNIFVVLVFKCHFNALNVKGLGDVKCILKCICRIVSIMLHEHTLYNNNLLNDNSLPARIFALHTELLELLFLYWIV